LEAIGERLEGVDEEQLNTTKVGVQDNKVGEGMSRPKGKEGEVNEDVAKGHQTVSHGH
jgi:hypothetical protein